MANTAAPFLHSGFRPRFRALFNALATNPCYYRRKLDIRVISVQYNDIFEYRAQTRGPRTYMALWLGLEVLYVGWKQGWGLVATLLCGPFLAYTLVRLVLNSAEGFRMDDNGLNFYSDAVEGAIDWLDLRAVTIGGDGQGGARCELHLVDGATETLPATRAFSPERLAQEFRMRGVPVWRPSPTETAQPLAA